MTENHSSSGSVPQSEARAYRRRARNLLIHKPMQREFMFVTIVLFMISAFAIGVIIHYTIREAAFGGGFRFGKINPYEVLNEVSYQLILWVSCVLFATLVVIASFGIFFLHRIAGPVHRFRSVLHKLNHGHFPPPVRLREGDFFTEVIDELNLLIRKSQAQQEMLKRIQDAAEAMVASQDTAFLHRSAREIQSQISSPHPPPSASV